MEKFYLKLEQANSVEIQVYPFTENDIFVFFDLETSIKITNAYIRIFGNEETNSDFVTCITEEGLYNFKILKQLSELFNLPFERDINELSIAFPECDCTVLIDDEGGSTFQTKNGYENLLKRICQYFYPYDYDYLYNLVTKHKNNYICFIPENREYKIYVNLRNMIENEFLP